MKSFEKTWQFQYQDIEVVVKNAWNLDRTQEEIRINNRVVYQNDVPMERAKLGKQLDFEENGINITIKIGSAWHCFVCEKSTIIPFQAA